MPRLQELGLLVVIFVIGMALSLLASEVRGENGFLRPSNLIPSVFTTMSWIAIMAIGMTVVIITGGIDISVGSVMGLSALACAYELQKLPPDASALRALSIGIGVPVGVGLLCGLFNGAMVVFARMHPFIVTLATMSIIRGIAQVNVITGSLPDPDKALPTAFADRFISYSINIDRTQALPAWIAWLPWILLVLWIAWFAFRWTTARKMPFTLLVLFFIALLMRVYLRKFVYSNSNAKPESLQPVPMILMLLVAIAGFVYLRLMVWGRETYAVGGNEEASRFSGIAVGWVKMRAYLIVGACAGIAGMISCGFYKAAQTNTAEGYELMVVAAAVVGGASLTGGRGTALGAVLGTLVIQLIDNGIVIMNQHVLNFGLFQVSITTQYTKIIVGVAILMAVGVDQMSQHLQARRLARSGRVR